MQKRETIERRVRELVEELAPVEAESIDSSSRLIEDVALDSVSILELLVTLETEFDLPPIRPNESLAITTLGQLQRHIADLALERE